MTPSPVEDLASLLAAAGDLVAGVRPDQWNDPTPCTDWDVREVVNHLVIGDRLFTATLRGEEPPAPGARDPKFNDALGDDAAAAQRKGARELIAELARPGVLEQTFQSPIGPIPGSAAARLRATEAVVHGWDIAQATGQDPRFPDGIVERILEFTRARLADAPPDRTPFGPPQPAPEDAPPVTRLAALLGRPVQP
ncbi:TIGR03086 family metal-binding protein [Actinomadura geliboluensis]|uniref:TIGR03086 family metal-binding protein n=1 Tax=Actinomadura geliboluensis TaxID=882440 RepID=UPI00369550DF